ncbi:MAG: DNA repair protein RecO [Verrucomicrobiota bacterium]
MKTKGTLIRRSPLTESSLIVHWCSEEYGIVKSVAKGARRPKSPFAGKLDLFYRCEIELHEAKKSDLHILKELTVTSPRLGLRKSYLQTVAASYFVRLIDRVAEPETPIPEVADLLERGLDYLDQKEVTVKAVDHFETQLAQILGIYDEALTPHHVLRDLFGNLPDQRQEVMEKLPEGRP